MTEETYKCSICKDVGFVYPIVNGKTVYEATSCVCRKGEQKERLIRYCELPLRTEKLTFETFKDTHPSLREAKKAALDLAEETGDIEWLTLTGGVDLGKTHLSIAIVRRWLDRGKPAKFVSVTDMLVWLRGAFDQNKRGDLTFAHRLDILKQVPLLVLDDLGAQKSTEWAMEQITAIIDYRYINHLPLVVTTNKSITDIPGDDEGRISSRLRRYDLGKVILMEAPEYRKREK